MNNKIAKLWVLFVILAVMGSAFTGMGAANKSANLTDNATNATEETNNAINITISNITESVPDNASGIYNESVKGTDSDGDGISDYDEIHGFTWENKTYFTNPYQASTDRDPYDDYMEITGIDMSTAVIDPGRHPCVPSYANLKVELEGMEVVPKCKITSTETKEEGDSWLLTTETLDRTKTDWGVESSFSIIPFSIGFKPYYRNERESYTYTLNSTSGWTREEWSTATAVEPDKAAKLKFHLKIKNEGTDAAKNVKLRFNVIIGEDKIADTVWTDVVKWRMEPGEVSDEMVIDHDRDGEIVITLEELKSIELGAPLSIEVTEVNAEVPWEGGWTTWEDYKGEIEPVSSTIVVDFGDGDVKEYKVWSGLHLSAERPHPYIHNITIKDAIDRTIGIKEKEDGVYIGWKADKEAKLENWTFGFDNDTFQRINETLGENWTLYDLLNVTIKQGWVIVMKAPDTKPPEIHWASYSRDMKTIKAGISDNENVTEVIAHVKVGDRYKNVTLIDEDGDLIYEATLSDKITDVEDDYILTSDGKFNTTWEDIPRITKTWAVDDDKKECPDADFVKIQDAINNESVVDGDTILVYPGVYCENVVLNKSLTLRGIDYPVIYSWDDDIINVTVDNCIIEGFSMDIITFSDDFSTNSGRWKYVGGAYRDADNKYVVLTENKDWQVGAVWFDTNITSNMTVEFRYKAGGGTGADGMVFMFYKKRDYTPACAGCLGFIGDDSKSVPGYGIEFDNYKNEYDPSGNHIALIKDHVKNHLIYVSDPRTEDNKWHNVSVEINETVIRVKVDNESLFNWTGGINKTYGGFGFAASTGGANNWHIIDDVKIAYKAPISDKVQLKEVVEPLADVKSMSEINESMIIPAVHPIGAMKISSCHNVVKNNIITGKYYGVRLYDSSNNRLEDNYIFYNREGIYLYNSSGNILKSNNILNNEWGIQLLLSSYNTITSNTINNNFESIQLCSSSYNTITSNTINNNSESITLFSSNNNLMVNNNVSNNIWGIRLDTANNNTIMDNAIYNNTLSGGPGIIIIPIGAGCGVCLFDGFNNTIANNKILNNSCGIQLHHESNTTITNNTIYNNTFIWDPYYGSGIYLTYSNNNTIYHNNIINNSNQAYDDGYNNSWDNGSEEGGNYWSDHACKGNPSNGSQPYYIEPNGVDRYPFEDKDGWLNVSVFGVDLSCNDTNKSIPPGGTAEYTIIVKNTGNRPDIINLTGFSGVLPCPPEWCGWESTLFSEDGMMWPGEGVEIMPGESINLTLYVSALGSCHSPGEIQTVNITGTSQGDPTKSDSVTTTTTIKQPSIFDTGPSENPYPSISGTHNGTITPNQTITVSKLYTYPCSGTGGHTEYARIWNNSGLDVNATWNGYKGDWHNISFNKSFTLVANEKYNYTIRTGSYPQIHHTDALLTANGWINCTTFTDVNGRIYYDWIPAIKLFQ